MKYNDLCGLFKLNFNSNKIEISTTKVLFPCLETQQAKIILTRGLAELITASVNCMLIKMEITYSDGSMAKSAHMSILHS